MRILYLADIRFPLERANGIQSMETCYALAARGHVVSMAVRADTQSPARDPFAFYGLAPIATLRIETVPVTGPPVARRTGYLTFAIGRSAGRGRQDLILTRDPGVASLLLRLPSAMRAPVVYEAHGIAADTAAAMPAMVSGGGAASPSKIRRLTDRDARVWHSADGYVTITAGLKNELERRFGPRSHVAVVPDGTRAATATEYTKKTATDYTDDTDRAAADARRPFTIGYAGHLYPWKGVDLVIEAVAAIPEARGLIVGGHEQEPDLTRVKALADTLFCGTRVTFTGMLPPSDVAARLHDADVLVIPNPPSALSREFTSPLKLFEYMASGRPIVASDLPSIREVLADDRNALLFEAGNPQALTAAVRRIKEDPALAARLAGQARLDVQDYTWARRAERLEGLFAEVVGREVAVHGGER